MKTNDTYIIDALPSNDIPIKFHRKSKYNNLG